MGAYGNTDSATVTVYDPDYDGLFSYCEVRAGTNEFHPDTDKDGIKDSIDVQPVNHLSPSADGFNLSITSDFSDPDLQDGNYSAGDKVNIRFWSSEKGIDWQRLNTKQVFYKLKLGNRTIQDGNESDGKVSCDLSTNLCTTQMDLAIGSGDYSLELQIKDRDGMVYQASQPITVNP